MNVRHLLDAFSRWRDAGNDLVLATVYETAGSTYSKAGAQMLIDSEGNFQGMLSGGCLEGDLAERAAAVLQTGAPQQVTYDLGSKDEELWGLGVGCDGLMRIFLQPLRAAERHQPFAAMATAYSGYSVTAAATVLASGSAALPVGATVVAGAEESATITAAAREHLQAGLRQAAAERRTHVAEVDIADGTASVLFSCLLPPPNVLVLGAGLDAEPVVRLIAELGWRVTIQDHRPAYIAKGNFRGAEQVLNLLPGELASGLALDEFDAAIVMSHHLQTDRQYLELLAATNIGYIGLLGPIARRRRLQADLGSLGVALEGRLHGPAGLDIGGRGPGSIALSIVAELHQRMMQDDV
jgi:xanthine/CO dehydrogenase XdhC/CoxF family maturation factor